MARTTRSPNSMKASLIRELSDLKRSYRDSRSTVLLLNELHRLPSGRTKLKRLIKAHFKSWGKKPPNLKYERLMDSYRNLSKLLNRFYMKSESTPTTSEGSFADLFRKHCRRELLRNIWIGNHQVDTFLPSARNNYYCGISYEIDGVPHNHEIKGRKDDQKERYLFEELQIITKRVENSDVFAATVKAEVDAICNIPNPDSRTKRYMWTRIAIETIAACHDKPKVAEDSNTFLRDLLGIEEHQIGTLKKLILENKHTTGRSKSERSV